MPKEVKLAAENEEVWFAHPVDPANLFFQVKVVNGVLNISGAHCAYGPSVVSVDRQSANTVLLSMPQPPKITRSPAEILAEIAPHPHVYVRLGYQLPCLVCGGMPTDPRHVGRIEHASR